MTKSKKFTHIFQGLSTGLLGNHMIIDYPGASHFMLVTDMDKYIA